MFDFISEKIKTLAKALTIVGCIVSIFSNHIYYFFSFFYIFIAI